MVLILIDDVSKYFLFNQEEKKDDVTEDKTAETEGKPAETESGDKTADGSAAEGAEAKMEVDAASQDKRKADNGQGRQ